MGTRTKHFGAASALLVQSLHRRACTMSQFRNSCLLSSLWSSEDSCTGCWDCTREVYKECGWKTRALMILERFGESGFGVLQWWNWVNCCSKRFGLLRVVVCGSGGREAPFLTDSQLTMTNISHELHMTADNTGLTGGTIFSSQHG